MPLVPKDFAWEEWFQSRGLRTLDYQIDILSNKLPKALEENSKPVIVAACPAAGKTLTSIAFSDAYFKINAGHRILVLTHGTTVLRSQYYEELKKSKPNFSFTLAETGVALKESNAQVVVTLPQTLHKVRNLPHFDLLIVDEAHHYYFSRKDNKGMVQSIIKRIKPRNQILLTGTPSPFILREYPIIPVTVNQIMEYGMVEDLLVELASSTYDFDNKDYNHFFDLKEEVKISNKDTRVTLDTLLKKIEERLTSIVKNYPALYAGVKNTTGWSAALRILGKTMIACKSVAQAKQVARYFKEKGINTALSTHDIDVNSKEVDRFKRDENCLVLIVVGRGILGFNLEELENVVDMTCSHNIDRIFQLMCRVIRKHPDGRKKFFFKVVPHQWTEYFRRVMDCVLTLTDEKNFLLYNGKNFLKLPIPVPVNKEQRKENKVKPPKPSRKRKGLRPVEIAGSGLGAISLMKDILYKAQTPLSPYCYATMQNVRNGLLNNNPWRHWTKESLIEDALKYNFRVEWGRNSHSAYVTAVNKGLLDICCGHMEEIRKPDGYWTNARIIEDALKYNMLYKWMKASPYPYKVAKERDILDKCTAHMVVGRKPNGYWTEKNILEDALNYERASAWENNSSGAYSIAQRKGLLKKACAHMKKREGVSFNKASNKWTVSLTYQGKCVWLGRFLTKKEALAARKRAEKRIAKGLPPKGK